ncbi:enoyl-CoA delta isomerase 2 [Folsomia candida]|uniref:enoyl-CoA delta isomerase 2 n=1 Tax=Folsomia candida TaxID=158441 RepID=UPI000B8FD446|nr:enoyl-CoA delta isomerase 2 [Folsomia candida]
MSRTNAVRQLLGKKILCSVQVNKGFATCSRLAFPSINTTRTYPDPSRRLALLAQNQVRPFMATSQRLSSEQFQEAVKNLGSVKDADNSTKLKLYALYKQTTVGKNNTKKPGMLDIVGKAKWDAWNSLGDMTQGEAEKNYIDIVNEMLGQSSKKAEPKSEEFDGLLVTIKGGIKTITLNRPAKKNALNMEMYEKIAAALRDSNDDDAVNIVVLTGSGDYFCSGNDLANFMNVTDPLAMAKEAKEFLQKYVAAYIDLKKPLIALINGPAVGIAVTVLGLCDAVFSTDKATFTTPFSSLGQSPEGCSSYIFPRVMGYAKASELLFFNQKFTARQAEECGLITQVFPNDRLQAEAWKRINDMAELPVKSLIFSKELVRGRERQLLHEVNRMECERLQERWTSEDCMNAIMKFFSKKSKM